MKRILYVSQISSGTTATNVQAIVSGSMMWNRRHDITGILIASPANFAQVLEGRAEPMAEVMRRIRGDSHHHAIEVRLDAIVSNRSFGRWSMAYIQRHDLADVLASLHAKRDATLLETLLETLTLASGDFETYL